MTAGSSLSNLSSLVETQNVTAGGLRSEIKPTWRLDLRSSCPGVRRFLQESQVSMNIKEGRRADLRDQKKRL
jgi:hypothetical protein